MKYRWPGTTIRSTRRAPRARAPVNALWLRRRAAWRIAPPGQELILDGLDAPQRAGDWAAWLDALPALDAQLRARSGKQGLPDAPTELLLGDDRSVALTLKPRGSLLAGCPHQEELERLVVSPRLTVRPANQDALRALQASGIHPAGRLWAARGVTHPDQTKLAWPARCRRPA